MRQMLSALLFATAFIVMQGTVLNAATYNIDGTLSDGAVVNLDITTSNTLNAYGYDIIGISGSITGHGTVSTFSGQVPNANDTVSSGLYVDLPGGHTAGSVWTVQNPANSGGANLQVDNVWTSTDPFLTYAGGVAFLMTDGLTGYLSAASPSNSAGMYYHFLGNYTYNESFGATVTSLATPLPAALPLFATGLGALGLLGWRRKKKAAALAA